MAVVLPGWLAGVASLVCGEVVGTLFTLNEDTLKQAGTTIGAFASAAAPALAQAEQGADRFTAATGGTTTATGQAFTGHWNTLAANGHTGTFMTIAQHTGPLIGLAAGAIALAKTGAIALLAQCAQQLAAATLTGAAGAMAAIRSITQTRLSIGALTRKLFTRLSDLVTTTLRRASRYLDDLINRLNIPNPFNRLQPAGHPPHLTGNTRTPTTPKGGYQVNAKKGTDDNVRSIQKCVGCGKWVDRCTCKTAGQKMDPRLAPDALGKCPNPLCNRRLSDCMDRPCKWRIINTPDALQ